LAAVAAIGGLAALHGTTASAAMQTWNFNSNSQSFNFNGNGNSLSMTSPDGVGLTVTGWSDTDDLPQEDAVEAARLIWAQSAALGVRNDDEGGGSPHHSVDSITGDSDGEFDMLLLEFDTAVALDGFDLSWARDGNMQVADVSILAYDGSGGAGVLGETWGDILSSNGGNYDSVGNYNNVNLSYYSVNSSIESTHWLIGVYNPVFGSCGGCDGGDDGFKLNLVKTETPDDIPPPGVPIPGSLPLMMLGLGLLYGRARSRRATA